MIKKIKLQNANLKILIAVKLISWAVLKQATIGIWGVFYLFNTTVFLFVAQ